jgi:hypothetical protein
VQIFKGVLAKKEAAARILGKLIRKNEKKK